MENAGNGFNSVLAMMWLVLGLLVACYGCLWFYSRFIEKREGSGSRDNGES